MNKSEYKLKIFLKDIKTDMTIQQGFIMLRQDSPCQEIENTLQQFIDVFYISETEYAEGIVITLNMGPEINFGLPLIYEIKLSKISDLHIGAIVNEMAYDVYKRLREIE